MKEKTQNLRQDFHDWLVKKGLSEKTKTGRPGTVYEYVRHIDKICDIVQSRHDGEAWLWLSKNIYLILGFSILCKKGSFDITSISPNYEKEFLKNFLDCFIPSTEKVQNYFIIQTYYLDGKVITEYPIIRLFWLEQGGNPDVPVTLKLNISKIAAKHERKILQKFYQFLEERFKCKESEKYSIDLSQTKDKLDNLKKSLKKYKSFEVVGGTNKYAPQLNPKFGSKCSVEAVRSLMQITTGAKIPIKPDHNGQYLVADANRWMKEHFYPSSTEEEGPTSSKWLTVQEVVRLTGWSDDQLITRRKRIAHVKISDRKRIFYPFDVEKLVKTKKIKKILQEK